MLLNSFKNSFKWENKKIYCHFPLTRESNPRSQWWKAVDPTIAPPKPRGVRYNRRPTLRRIKKCTYCSDGFILWQWSRIFWTAAIHAAQTSKNVGGRRLDVLKSFIVLYKTFHLFYDRFSYREGCVLKIEFIHHLLIIDSQIVPLEAHLQNTTSRMLFFSWRMY